MGLFRAIMRSRAEKKALMKAAQARARAEVKEQARLEIRREKLLTKHEARLNKEKKKARKAQQRHESKMAKATLNQLKAGRFSSGTVLRYSAALRAAAPLLLPLIYKAVAMLRAHASERQDSALGVSARDLQGLSGYGASLMTRISGMRSLVKSADLPEGYRRDCLERLRELETAVRNAENMPDEQRGRAQETVTKDLDSLSAEVSRRQRA